MSRWDTGKATWVLSLRAVTCSQGAGLMGGRCCRKRGRVGLHFVPVTCSQKQVDEAAMLSHLQSACMLAPAGGHMSCSVRLTNWLLCRSGGYYEHQGPFSVGFKVLQAHGPPNCGTSVGKDMPQLARCHLQPDMHSAKAAS